MTQKQNALFSFWRMRAVMITLGAAYVVWRYFAPYSLDAGHRIQSWYVPFYVCWAVSCWPQVLDKQFGIYCTLSPMERKRLPKTASYYIANLFGLAAISIPIGGLLLSLIKHFL